mmetsp:Transcript_55060/g.133775  ORF Transcript_55060/g.133775 Transcript_55060/m.133775 type:complete len:88 (-) Transcript_55060:705-968(-)
MSMDGPKEVFGKSNWKRLFLLLMTDDDVQYMNLSVIDNSFFVWGKLNSKTDLSTLHIDTIQTELADCEQSLQMICCLWSLQYFEYIF